ncbi:unnamed protein product [Effrenium voratum]|nr:unnamed protein product [Effrenium voratum]
MEHWDLDAQLAADYVRFRPTARACLPQPFFRAKKRKKTEAASNRDSGGELPAEQAKLRELCVGELQRHVTCAESCVQRAELSAPGPAVGRSEEETIREGVVLPAGCCWVQGDLWAGDLRRLAGAGFRAAVVDPPWESKSRGLKYQSCQPQQLLQLPLGELLAPDALVAVWVTNDPKKQAFVRDELFKSWGVQAVACWTWVKVTNQGEPVLPFGSERPRLPFEKVLVARKPGSEPAKEEDRVFSAVPGLHSQKPFLDAWLPEGPKLELFARNLRPGWTSLGNQVLLFQKACFFEPEEKGSEKLHGENPRSAPGGLSTSAETFLLIRVQLVRRFCPTAAPC